MGKDEHSRELDPSSNITVIPLTQDDVQAYVSLSREIVRDSPYLTAEEKERVIGMTTPQLFEERLNDKNNFYVMMQAKTSTDEIVGFLSGRAVDYEGLPNYQNVAYIAWVGVSPG